jgi:RPA family protein
MDTTTNNQQQTIERQIARISSIKELNTGKYIKQEGWEPNYILTNKDEKISRVNIIGVVVTTPENGQSVFLDDGTGKIEIRSFEQGSLFSKITIGDIVIVIGRPRTYNEEIYINAELIKKIENKGWLEYRKKEILLKNLLMPDKIDNEKNQELEEHPIEIPTVLEKDEKIDQEDLILMKIKQLDSGSGCNMQEVIDNIPDSEPIIEKLLLNGEIFEISPGKIKILE